MQSLLRSTARRPLLLASHSEVQWVSRRHASGMNPLNWLQEKLAPRTRAAPAPEVDVAKQENPNLFQAAAAQPPAPATSETQDGARQASKKSVVKTKKTHTEHKYSTPNFKISHRKLNDLGRQISGKPIDYAIMQMQFSEKRASKRIETMLMTAKSHAVKLKGLPGPKLVVAEAWVTKGPKQLKRFEPKGRGKYGIRTHPDSKLHVVLRPGKTHTEKVREDTERKLKRIISAGLVREDVPLRNPSPMYAW